MTEKKQTAELPGYEKKSFLLYYNGGEIWFEHLECMHGREDTVLKKLDLDSRTFLKPSSTSFLCFVFFDTAVTDNIILAVKNILLGSNKHFTKIAFCGLDKRDQRKFKRALSDQGFGAAFFDGLEDAKRWLLP